MNYTIKIDDLLIMMLKDYHEIEPSEVFSFFGARIKEAIALEPNINDKSVRRNIVYDRRLKTTKSRYGGVQAVSPFKPKFYVLRGYYPNTKIPFKMVTVTFVLHTMPYAKVQFGVRDEFTLANNKEIDIYDAAIAESLLLEKEIEDENKVPYKFKKFRCMRPKGMLLYKKSE